MTAWRLLGRGWRVFVPVILASSVLQAATTAPVLTPSATPLFALLALASAAAIVIGAALTVAQARASAEGTRLEVPLRLWVAASVTIVLVGAAALVTPSLILLVLTLAVIVLPGLARGEPLAGFRLFRITPGRAVGLAVVTVATMVLLWAAALLLGFFITGVFAAALAWLAFGTAAVVITCAWTALLHRRSPDQES